MIKQDYIVRMIQEIISAIAEAILNKKNLKQKDWEEYDRISKQLLGIDSYQLLNMPTNEIIEKYKNETDGNDKIELVAVNMMKMAEEAENNILLRNKLRQDSLSLLIYLQNHGIPSLLRESLITLLRNNG